MNAARINGQRYLIPECWEEVTVSQYLRMLTQWEPEKDIADRDYVKLLNIFTEGKFQHTDDIGNTMNLVRLLGWVAFQPFQFKSDLPKVLHLAGKSVLIPREPSELSIGQNIHLRRAIGQSSIVEQSIAIATAIYLQPVVDGGKFNMSRARELEKEILEMPVYQIYPVGFFLLTRVASYGQTSSGLWHRVKTNLGTILKRMSLN